MTRSVQVAPGHVAELPFDLALGLLWYDISLTCAHEPEFLYQFAGRIETGQPGRTDPVMGRAVCRIRAAARSVRARDMRRAHGGSRQPWPGSCRPGGACDVAGVRRA
ncbi:hypothetical protein RAA17_10735 [Komagataeibacter rhaeticus]|nr:hypothetical protein [Komagataeibacter rhaeticus]